MKKKDLNIIRSIQAEAWGKFGDKLFIEQDIAPTVLEVANKALNDDEVDETTKGGIRMALETGEYNKKVRVEDPEVAKEYEEFVGSRIQEEIKKGNLSKPDPKKIKQYERRLKARNS